MGTYYSIRGRIVYCRQVTQIFVERNKINNQSISEGREVYYNNKNRHVRLCVYPDYVHSVYARVHALLELGRRDIICSAALFHKVDLDGRWMTSCSAYRRRQFLYSSRQPDKSTQCKSSGLRPDIIIIRPPSYFRPCRWSVSRDDGVGISKFRTVTRIISWSRAIQLNPLHARG